MSRLITTNEIEAIHNKLSANNSLGPDGLRVNYTKHLKKNEHLLFSNYFFKNSRGEKTPKFILPRQNYPNSKTR